MSTYIADALREYDALTPMEICYLTLRVRPQNRRRHYRARIEDGTYDARDVLANIAVAKRMSEMDQQRRQLQDEMIDVNYPVGKPKPKSRPSLRVVS